MLLKQQKTNTLGHVVNIHLHLWETAKLFSQVAESFCIPPGSVWVPIAPHSCKHLVLSVFLFKLALILQCGLNLHFSNDWWWMIVWHLYIFFWCHISSNPLPFWKKLVCLFSYYWARRLIYIFLMQILYRRILEIFSPNLSPVFHLLNIAFRGTEDYNFDEVQFIRLLWVILFLL